MLRAILIGFVVSAAMALAARLIVRWRFGGRGRSVRRLKPHGAVEYGSFVLLIAAAGAITLIQRAADGLGPAGWALSALIMLVVVADAYTVFLTQLFWTNEGLGSWDPIRKQRFIRWADVTRCRVRWHGTYLADGASSIGFAPWRDGADELRRFLKVRCAAALAA